jgi:hypothetical protein
MNSSRWSKLICALALCSLLLGACGGASAGGASVWIDVPLDGLSFPGVQAIKIEGHAASSGGVGRVELWINGVLLTTIDEPPMEGDLASYHTEWTPPASGEYVIQAVAYSRDGAAGDPDTARVTFGGGAAGGPDLAIVSVEAIAAGEKDGIPFCNTRVVYTNAGSEAIPSDFSIQFHFDGTTRETTTVAGGLLPGASTEAIFIYQFQDMHYIGINLDSGNVIAEGDEGNNAFAEARVCGTATPTPVVSVTPTIGLGPIIQFWAEPDEIKAGACTTLHWHAEGVSKVVFGGKEQPNDGSYKDCLCKDERYTLTVTHSDGTEEKRRADVKVNGVCATPVPEDNTAPPAPEPAVPAYGLTLSCRGSQSLAWLPVTDPSGIASYQVEVQRHSGDNKWKAAPGSPITTEGKSTTISVECAWTYRWRVRAVDGVGNVGGWSGWSQFTVTLE